jgi:uncharacterized membrane protein
MEKIIEFQPYSSEKTFFDSEEILLLEEVSRNVSYALQVIEKDALRKKAEEEVSQVKGATIHLHRCLLWVYFLFRC